MRIAIILLLLLAGLQAYGQKHLVIAFYNAENLFDTLDDPITDDNAFTPRGAYKYTKDIYRQKLRNTAFVLKKIAESGTPPAIIGLAEIENKRVLEDLINDDQIKNYGYKHLSYESPDPRGIDVALLYRPSVFMLVNSKPVGVTIDVNGHNEATRDMLFVTGVLEGRDTIHLLINHWPSRREGKGETAPKRKQAAVVNKLLIDSLMKRNPQSKIILMGDLNDDPTDESVANILNASSERERIKPYTLYNPWASLHANGKGSVAFQNKWNLFDQLIVSRGFLQKDNGWQLYKAEIFDREFLLTRSGKQQGYPYRSWRGYRWMNGYSDHLPVLLYLQRP